MLDLSQSRVTLAAPNRLHASIQALFIGVFVMLLAVLAAGQWLRRAEALRSGESRAANLALILGDHLDRTISAVDTMLEQLALHGERMGGPKAPAGVWTPILAAARSGISGIGSVSVLDETGTVTQSTVASVVGESRADLYLFQRLANQPSEGLVADMPFRGRTSGRWVIPIGRRLTGPDGRFAGVIVATLEPSLLHNFYRTVDVGREGVIWLLHPTGSVLVREPAAGPTDERAGNNPFRNDLDAVGMHRGSLEPGGQLYLSAYRRIASVPISVAVSLAERDLLTAWWKQAIASTSVIAFVGVLLIFAGRWITREIKARADAESQVRSQAEEISAALDKHEQAAAALRSNQALFQSIMDHAPMMLLLKDLDGRYTFVSRAFRDFTGRGADTMIGKTAADFNTEEFSRFIADQDRAVIAGRRTVQRQMTIPRKDSPRTVLMVKFPVFGQFGDVVSVGTVAADITEHKRIEAQLSQVQRIDAVGQLTGGIAHDFNNLLTALLLNADALLSQIGDSPLRPMAEAMKMAAERGADLTRRLLAFGRRQMLEPRPTNVTALLAGMEPLMHRTLGEHIEIELRHAADMWAATVDPSQLENAVFNLALNSRDAMPDGGHLTIETANAALDEANAAVNPDVRPGDYVMIAVSDTGGGMTPDIVAHAFEPFFTTKEVGKGTGLGLSMVYGFAKQSGGHARIYSEVGRGTTVRLYLPRSGVADVVAEAGPPSAAELPRGAGTILFVEDDPLVRSHTEKQLAELGYQVVTAENGPAALAQIEKGCVPDLLFTDVMMPGGMNGRELARRLLERWPHLPVLYSSGYAHHAFAQQGEPVPAKYMLGKPYRRRDLAAKLREMLNEPVAAAE